MRLLATYLAESLRGAAEPGESEVRIRNNCVMTSKRLFYSAISCFLSAMPPNRAQTLTVTSRLVQVPVIAFNSDGTPLQGLRKEDFSVYDDDVQQNITHLWTDADAPLAIGLVLDVSGTQLPHLLENRALLIDFLQSVARPQDHVFLETFDSQARFVSESTGSIEPIVETLNRFSRERANHPHWIGTAMPFPCQGKQRIFGAPCGNSVVWNAVANASERLRQQPGRRALVLITDGQDSGSNVSLDDALRAAQNAAAAVFALGLPDPYHHNLNRSGLEKLARSTGGDVFLNQTNAKPAFARLDRELRSEYVLSYKLSSPEAPGRTHVVTVHVAQAKTVQCKTQYTEAP